MAASQRNFERFLTQLHQPHIIYGCFLLVDLFKIIQTCFSASYYNFCFYNNNFFFSNYFFNIFNKLQHFYSIFFNKHLFPSRLPFVAFFWQWLMQHSCFSYRNTSKTFNKLYLLLCTTTTVNNRLTVQARVMVHVELRIFLVFRKWQKGIHAFSLSDNCRKLQSASVNVENCSQQV